MDEVTRGRCLDKLTKRREVVMITLRHLEKEQHEADENNDWLDQAAYNSRVALLDRLTEGYLKENSEIDRAITRINERTYGLCVACHEPIETRRLEAFPEVEFCSGCKEMREEFEETEELSAH
ncbi:MAG TPA: TraR/DksA C4-type zinc finger protein [Methylomirabilota bacterium]|nr:TraR/DksA C4-type zinc finger protein [Methylomirabilota bacterium]